MLVASNGNFVVRPHLQVEAGDSFDPRFDGITNKAAKIAHEAQRVRASAGGGCRAEFDACSLCPLPPPALSHAQTASHCINWRTSTMPSRTEPIALMGLAMSERSSLRARRAM